MSAIGRGMFLKKSYVKTSKFEVVDLCIKENLVFEFNFFFKSMPENAVSSAIGREALYLKKLL